MSYCPSDWDNSAVTGRILVKFVEYFYKIQVSSVDVERVYRAVRTEVLYQQIRFVFKGINAYDIESIWEYGAKESFMNEKERSNRKSGERAPW
jgi:hypothetical protein